jgi:hypothetical protein
MSSDFFFREPFSLWDEIETCSGDRWATNYVTIWRIRVACWISKTTRTHACALTHTHTDKYAIFITFFYGNNCSANAPWWYVIHTLPVLFSSQSVPRLRQLVADVYCRDPDSIPGESMWRFWWIEWHWDRVLTEQVLRFSAVSMDPPVLDPYPSVHVALIGRTNRGNVGNIQKQRFLGIGGAWHRKVGCSLPIRP